MGKFQSLKWYIGMRLTLIVVLFGISACNTTVPAPTSSPANLLASATPRPTAYTTATPSPTSVAATPLPPTPKPASAQPIAILRPTLTADEELDFVREMLKTNAECELPCWWDITPGKTDWQVVPEIFGKYGITSRLYQGTYSYYSNPAFSEQPVYYNFSIDITRQQDLVQSVKVQSEALGDTSTDHFAQDWQRYAPEQVLSRHGEPSQVYLHIVPWTPAYTLELAYRHLGFDIIYGGTPTHISPTTMHVCFDFAQVNFIYLELQSLQPEEATHEGAGRPLEEATEMDVETFYALLRDPDSDICFETPTELWP